MKLFSKRRKRPIFLCHGCFDFLHVGHMAHLVEVWERASRLNGLVYVSVTADRFVNKGPGRPLMPDEERAELLSMLPFVDRVEVIHDASGVPAIQMFRPRYYCKGADYRGKESSDPNFVAEIEALTDVGGTIYFTTADVYHSTDYLERYRNAFNS